MCDQNVKDLYDNLKKVLGHFSMSARSTEFLNKALAMLQQNDVHMLVWGAGGTRMGGFLDACRQSSRIVIPFLDTLVTAKIRPDETAYLMSPKGELLNNDLFCTSLASRVVFS
jgi:hypothetical protein